MNPERPRSKSHHNDRAAELIAHEAANFIAQEAGPGSLITVVRALPLSHGEPARTSGLVRSGGRMTVFVSVFPEDRGRAAISFLERQRTSFSEHLKKHTRLRPLPRVDFMLDDRSTTGGPGGN